MPRTNDRSPESDTEDTIGTSFAMVGAGRGPRIAVIGHVDEIGLGAIDGNNGPVLLLPDDSTERRLTEARETAVAAERALARYREESA